MLHDISDLSSPSHQVIDVPGLQVLEHLFDFILNPCIFEEVPIGIGGNGKAIGNADPFIMEFSIHLSKGGALSADHGNIIYADFIKPEDKVLAPIRHRHSPLNLTLAWQMGLLHED